MVETVVDRHLPLKMAVKWIKAIEIVGLPIENGGFPLVFHTYVSLPGRVPPFWITTSRCASVVVAAKGSSTGAEVAVKGSSAWWQDVPS